jgi:hypothetical protein
MANDNTIRELERAVAADPSDERAVKRLTAWQLRTGAAKAFEVDYSENNSGGSWWLDAADYVALIAAGWTAGHTAHDGTTRSVSKVFVAASENAAYDAAVAEWTALTGGNATATGCECCGSPHYFSTQAVGPETILALLA